MIVNGVRVSRERMAGDPLNLGALFKKGIKGLGHLALGAGKAYLGIPPKPAQSTDSFTKQLAQGLGPVGTKRNPAKIYFPSVMPGVGSTMKFGGAQGVGGRRYRRMRVTNVRALRRAFRRVEGFGRLARRYVRTTHRFKPRAFARKRRR